MPTDLCPCGSQARYRTCCAPLHRGEREPQDAPSLMRARFAAFDRKELDFLLRTLHPSHPDARRSPAEVLLELRASAQRYRYVRLQVLGSDGPDAHGVARVLFCAELFDKGKDRSFMELSEFERSEGHWRYARGEAIPVSDLPSPPPADIAAFEALLQP